MNDVVATEIARFGTVLGIAPGGIPVYSSDYDSADDEQLPDRHAYRSYVDGIYMGQKWQCVELARRWMYFNCGYIFDDVAMAYEIFELTSVRVINEQVRLPLHSFRNGSRRHPEPGCLIIWDDAGEFEDTGHVAVVTEVLPDAVRFVEQNVGHRIWPEGQQYSREIKARITEEGEYWLECSYGDAIILGWVIQTEDAEHAEPVKGVDRRLFRTKMRRVRDAGAPQRSWLNLANPDEAAYVSMMKGHRLSSREEDRLRYLCISDSAHEELRNASNELHALFMHATEFVLRDDTLLSRFNLPPAIWPRIHQSFNNRRTQMITGRFDFALSEEGLKVYEYNCDSASCHMECGKVQGIWARSFGCRVGDDPGKKLHEELRDAWRGVKVDGVVHIMQDHDLEETYHALYMREAMERAGIESKILHGVAGLRWDEDGNVLDPDGLRIRWVWKTWAWETALDQIRAECEDDEERLRSYAPGERRQDAPRLVDVLLRADVMVYEPLWTLIPSNKAILPVLWSLFPNHPYLLESSFELSETLQANGYVQKPIVGRCGSNIKIVDGDNRLIEETAGGFDDREQIYQQLFRLPVVDGYNVQMCTFTAAGGYAGSCTRVDPSMVINQNSDVIALRVVDDEDILPDPE